MPTPPFPEIPEALLIDYVLGALGPNETRALEEQLAQDPALAERVEGLQRTWETLAYSAYQTPPAQLGARIQKRAYQQQRLRTLPWLPVGGAIAALGILVLGLDNYQLRQELNLITAASTTLQQPNVILSFALRGTGTAALAQGQILMDLDTQKAGVALNRLPEPPRGKVYRLWALVGTKSIPCGTLRIDGQGQSLSQLPLPVDAYTGKVVQLRITLETDQNSLQPLGPTVMISS